MPVEVDFSGMAKEILREPELASSINNQRVNDELFEHLMENREAILAAVVSQTVEIQEAEGQLAAMTTGIHEALPRYLRPDDKQLPAPVFGCTDPIISPSPNLRIMANPSRCVRRIQLRD